MAKYRITSIPQYAPGGETNWPPDWMKRKKKKLNSVTESATNYRPTSEEDRVQGVDPQNIWSDINPTNVPRAEQFPTYDIGPQDYGRKRSGLEQYETLPIAFNQEYGLKTNPSTGKIETVPAGNYQDQYGRTRNVKANKFTNVDNQGRPLNCPSGSRAYNGVCLTNEEYKQVIDKEESNIEYTYDVRIKEEEERERKKQEEYAKNYRLYLENNTKKGSKKNKLEPWQTFNKKKWEERGMDNWYNTSGSNEFYLDKKDIGDGNYEYNLYPKAVIENMMSMQGVRPVDFQKTSGLNAEKLQGEYNDYIKFLDSYYDYQGKELIDKYTKKGMSAQQVKQQLIKDGYVDEKKFNKLFKDVAEGFDYKNNGDKFFVGENDNVLYKTDRNNKVYEYNNDTWTLVKPTKEQEANFKNMSEKDRKIFSAQGTYMAGDKLYVAGNLANFYGATLNNKQQTSVINDYKKAVNDNKAAWEAANPPEGSQIYSSYNNELYSHVYGTDYSIGNLKKINPLEIPTIAERISGTNIDSPNIGYTQAYNKVVDELNAVTKNKKSTDSFEDIRKKKAAILEKFINLAGSGDKDRGKYNQPSWGLLPQYNYTGTFGPSTFQTKDITAYKDKDKLASQLTFARDNEAQNYLYQAYQNNIVPNQENIMNEEYRGDEKLKEKYPTFQDFVQSPEGKAFYNSYIQAPGIGRTMFEDAYMFKDNNLAQDKYDKEVALAKKGLLELQKNAPWYANAIDQGMSLITQPWSTIDQWRQGELQKPFIGLMGDQPTTQDLENLESQFGTGYAQAYIDNISKIGQSPVSQITNLLNPFHFAAETGRGLKRKYNDDPEANWEDIGLNALFAAMPFKGTKAFMGLRPLTLGSKFVPAALKTGKVLPRIGTAATNYLTPGNALNAYFLKHAFVPSTNPETGETVQGFGTEAFKNIYKGLTDENGINMDMISPNLVNAYMAYSIGKHGLHNANYVAGNLLGKPALVPRLPIQDRISEGFQKFVVPPLPFKDPRTGNIKYEDVQFNPTIKYENNNKFGEGGSIKMDLTQDEINSYVNGGWIVEDLDTYQGGGGGGGKGKARREAKRASKITSKQAISKKLADLTFNNYLNETAPEQMSLITYLKNNNLISKTLPEGDLVTYPNLLNLATKKGIQNALTFSRSTAGTDFGISSSGTKTELSPGDLEAYKKFNLENDEVGKGLYAATHIPFMRYGQRTGLTNLPYKIEEIKVYKFGEGETDYVVADTIEEAQQAYLNQFGQNIDPSKLTKDYLQQATPDSFDALYTYANNTGLPTKIKKGIFDDQYGKFTSILRYPFDYSGSAYDMLSKFTDLEKSTFTNAEILRRTGGREFPLRGSIGAFNFTDKPTLQNSFLAPLFAYPETPVIGHPGQKLFDPVATYYKPELEQIDKEIEFVHTLFKDKKYDEAINFLNDKIKTGQFGSVESNIQSIKDNPKFPKFKFDYISDNNMGNYLNMLDIINPKTGLIDTGLKGKELENLVNNARQAYDAFMYHGPRANAFDKTDNVEKIPYSPFRFKFKDGGELPKARRGKPVKTRKYQFKKPLGTYTFPNVEGKVVPTSNPDAIKAYWDMWNKVNQKKLIEPSVPTAPINEVPMADLEDLSKTTGGNSLIQYGDEPFQGESFYHADPADYIGSEPGFFSIEDWKKQANIDAYANLEKAMANNPPYGKDLFKGLGDFNFKVWSDNWNSLQDLKNSMDGPQWVPTKDDYFSKLDFSSKIMDQMEYDLAKLNFDYDHPESVNKSDIMRLEEDISRDELFSYLYPNVGLPNFRNKILSPEQQSYLEKFVGDYNPSVYQRGRLNPEELKKITTGFETLPKTYQQLLERSKENDFLKTGPAKVVVNQMRDSLGLSLEEVLTASPEQLEIWRNKIVIKMGKQDLERWERDISNPFTGINAWGKITNETGYKNKFGGVSMKLSKDEIDKYVNGGYIVTEE